MSCRIARSLCVILLFALMVGCAPVKQKPITITLPPMTVVPPTATAQPTPTQPKVDAFAMNQKLGRGINLGNALEAPKEGDWGVRIKDDYFQIIRDAGFNSVRIPVRWSNHTLKKMPNVIDKNFFARVDEVVEQALDRDLTVILNIHHYEEIMKEPAEQRDRFLFFWKQIAEHYRNYPDNLYFELLNEPNGDLKAKEWNELINAVIPVIRESSPDRILIIGPGEWYNISQLSNLSLPENDRAIIVSFHYYEPFNFTHQGAEWTPGMDAYLGTTWSGSEQELKRLSDDFANAAKWAQRNNRPLYLGEFGAYSKADMDSQARYTAAVVSEAEKQGISWAYWEFCSGFGAYDLSHRKWYEPLLKALIH